MKNHLLVLLPGLLVSLCGAGCGAGDAHPTGKLTGKVTLDGKPLEVGTVQVVTADGKAHGSGILGKEGVYEIPNAPVGVVKVAVLVPDASAPPPPRGLKLNMKDAKDPGPPEDPAALKLALKLPAGYRNPQSSSLTTTIKSGDNSYDLPLTTKFRSAGS
jgi:hypothetical protein